MAQDKIAAVTLALTLTDNRGESGPAGTSQQSKQPEAESACWIEVTPERQPGNPIGIRIERDGFYITVERGFDPKLLVGVLQAVSRACC